MSELVIQSITKNDISACLAIYNYEVINGVATLDLEPRTNGITRTAMSIIPSL